MRACIGRINVSRENCCMINAAILRVLIMQSVINYLVRAERRRECVVVDGIRIKRGGEKRTGGIQGQHHHIQSLCIKTVARSRFYIIAAIIYLIVKDGAYISLPLIFLSRSACTWLMNINFSPDELAGFGRAQNLNSPPEMRPLDIWHKFYFACARLYNSKMILNELQHNNTNETKIDSYRHHIYKRWRIQCRRIKLPAAVTRAKMRTHSF